MKPIYLDYNATTPVDGEVAEAMRPYIEEFFGNPSSSHWYGATARKAVEAAREQVAELLGCGHDRIVFTSGGTESNNFAIKGTVFPDRTRGDHIITSSIEHPAVIQVCRYLESRGFMITYLPVDEHGLIDPASVETAITPGTVLITIMHANNEVGTIQPITDISEIAKRKNIIVHTDAAQSCGKIPIDVRELGVGMLSVAGHKMYAPKGVGALYIGKGISLEKQMHGADHEMNLRAGTENVVEIVGLGKACEIAARDLEQNREHMRKNRDRLESGFMRELENVRINGHLEKRLPNTSNVSFTGVEAGTLLSRIPRIAASAGAACHSGSVELSTVLTAMGVPKDYARGTIRFSTGKYTTVGDVDSAVEYVTAAVKELRSTGNEKA